MSTGVVNDFYPKKTKTITYNSMANRLMTITYFG